MSKSMADLFKLMVVHPDGVRYWQSSILRVRPRTHGMKVWGVLFDSTG